MDVGVNLGPRPGAPGSHQRSLLAYTAVEIIAGMVLLVWTTATVQFYAPIDPGLTATALDGPLGGALLWILFGFLGSLRVLRAPGGGVFTFHLPFIGAAMVLGGPTAGAWVAFLSTIERRELEQQPWYGLLANHATLVIGAVMGGIASSLVLASAAAPSTSGLPIMLAAVVGTVVLAVVSTALAAGTWILRDELSPRAFLGIITGHIGRMTAFEVGLAWVLVMAYVQVGWWTPVLIGGLILLAWKDVTVSGESTDGVLSAKAFENHLEAGLGQLRRGSLPGATVVLVGIDDLDDVARRFGPVVHDAALAEIGTRLAAWARRPDDLAGRLDESRFALFLPGLVDAQVAMRRAGELIAVLTAPITTPSGPVAVSATAGVVMLPKAGTIPSTGTVLRHADQARFQARGHSGVHLYDPREPGPFEDGRRDDRGPGDADPPDVAAQVPGDADPPDVAA